MIQPKIKTVQCLSPGGLHKMAYQEWGDEHNPNVLLCVHGLTRVSDDFDNLAQALCDTYRVVCPDVVGRGRSDWLRNPQYYQISQYVSDMVTLLARLDGKTVDLFGTSMGGLIGIDLASLPNSPIRKLVLNDVGPVLNPTALTRIRDYLGRPIQFATLEEATQYIRTISAPFGSHTDTEWRKLALNVLRQDKDGQWILHSDAELAIPFKGRTPEMIQQDEIMTKAAYDAITCPILIVRGAESDLLSHDAALDMTTRGPKATLVELPGVGHAPTFMHADQIGIAKDFLFG